MRSKMYCGVVVFLILVGGVGSSLADLPHPELGNVVDDSLIYLKFDGNLDNDGTSGDDAYFRDTTGPTPSFGSSSGIHALHTGSQYLDQYGITDFDTIDGVSINAEPLDGLDGFTMMCYIKHGTARPSSGTPIAFRQGGAGSPAIRWYYDNAWSSVGLVVDGVTATWDSGNTVNDARDLNVYDYGWWMMAITYDGTQSTGNVKTYYCSPPTDVPGAVKPRAVGSLDAGALDDYSTVLDILHGGTAGLRSIVDEFLFFDWALTEAELENVDYLVQTAVPEPATMTLLLVGAGFLFGRKRR